MTPKYRVALIGCGGRGHAHAAAIKTDERLQLVALADPNREAAEAVNTEYNFDAKIYTDYNELLATEKPDIVAACLWTPLHLQVYRDCVNAGVKAVLSEKPMAATWGECRELARIAEESNCQLTFCHQRRFAKGNQFVRQLVADGTLGEIKHLDLSSPPNLLDCGTHTVDQALSFLGETPGRWVLGAVDTSEVLNWFNVRAETMAIGTIVFENGVRANIQTGGPDHYIWSGVRLLGTKGYIEVLWDGDFKQAALFDQPDWKPPVFEDDHDLHMSAMVRNAVDCLESGEEPETSWQKALRAAEILFALYESVRQCKRITLPLADFDDSPLHALLDGEPVHVQHEQPVVEAK